MYLQVVYSNLHFNVLILLLDFLVQQFNSLDSTLPSASILPMSPFTNMFSIPNFIAMFFC